MNEGALNSYALNAGATDSVVRVTVTGEAFAIADVLSRVNRLSKVISTGSANAVTVSRRFTREAVINTAQTTAVIKSLALIRSVVVAQAQAQAEVWSGMVRGIVNQTVQAISTVNLKTFAGLKVNAEGLATSFVVERDYLRSVLLTTAQAFAQVKSGIRTPSPVTAEGQALSTVTLRTLLRSPGFSEAEAVGFVGGNVIVRRPFDEVAQEEYTYLVAYVDNVFFVR